MERKRIGCIVGLGAALALSLAGTAKANTVQLASGSVVDGWSISFVSSFVSIFEDDGTSALIIKLEKQAVFTANQGLLLSFTQVSHTGAAPTLQILDETLTNLTGSPWSGFQNLLSTLNGGTSAAANFDATFDANSVSPFTSSTIVNPQDIVFSGGTFGNGETHEMGAGPSLIQIQTHPSTDTLKVISLKEIPITAVPVPTAAWMGLMTVACLGGATAIRRRSQVA